MLDLGEVKYAFLLIPLIWVLTMYVVSGHISDLGFNFLLAMVAGTIITVISTAMIPLTGNSEGTYTVLAVGFALAFWGISLAGLTGFSVVKPLQDLAHNPFSEWQLQGLNPKYFPNAQNNTYWNSTGNSQYNSLDVANLNMASIMPSFGGWSGSQIWATIMIILSFCYCLGIYFMITSRGK